jgi:hypothetical protein
LAGVQSPPVYATSCFLQTRAAAAVLVSHEQRQGPDPTVGSSDASADSSVLAEALGAGTGAAVKGPSMVPPPHATVVETSATARATRRKRGSSSAMGPIVCHDAAVRVLAAAAILLLGCSSEKAADAPDTAPRDSGVDVADSHPHVEPDTRPEAEPEIPPPEVPATLEATGLYSDFAARTLAADVFQFDVRYPLWSDGADKGRYLLIPAGKQIDTSTMDHWTFPTGTKAWKEFRRDGLLVETRYLEKSDEKPIGWKYVAYQWSADGKTATVAKMGVTNALGTAHDIPSQEQCEQCHSGTKDGLIGLGAIQLSRESGVSPLAALAAKGWLSTPPGREFSPPGTGNVQDALGYLHGNCGYCHSDVGRWSGARKLRLRVLVADTDPTKTPTYLTTINVPMAHADITGEPYIGVIPGDPLKSHLYDRMLKRDFWAMPPTGTEQIDDAGSAIIKTWIESLK